jgi:membrane protein implicated in regulation of membrane protease activity
MTQIQIILLVFAFLFSPLILTNFAYAATSEGCGIFEIKAGCDLSVWMALILGELVVGAVLAIFLHYLGHRSQSKLEKDSDQLKENSKRIEENSIAIQKILDSQENARNRRRDYLLENSTSHFNAILLHLGMMDRLIQNKQNLNKDEQYSKLESEESAIYTIIKKLRKIVSLSIDILDPMLSNQIESLLVYIEQNTPSTNKEKLEFSDYEKTKDKILHIRDRLKEFETTDKVLK